MCGIYHPPVPENQQMTFNFECDLPQNFNGYYSDNIFGQTSTQNLSQAHNIFQMGLQMYHTRHQSQNMFGQPTFLRTDNYKIEFSHNFTLDSKFNEGKIKETITMKKIY